MSFDQVECLWEPYMVLAARIREVFGLPGLTVEQTLPFRDKELMKQVLDAAGIRTPRHASSATVAGIYDAAERIGYPLIIKPLSGAGSADTFRVDDLAELTEVLPMIKHVEVVSIEEFIEAEEFTYDTVCGAGDHPAREHQLVPAAPAAGPQSRVDQSADRRAPRHRRRSTGRRPGDGSRCAAYVGFPVRIHPHGVVPQGRR